MSDNYLTVIPDDPRWQPDEEAAARAVAALAAMLPKRDWIGEDEVRWHEAPHFVLCGENLERILCPRCGADHYQGDWWGRTVSERHAGGYADLEVTVPCCGAGLSLNDLAYDWPCGFARFEISVLYPDRGWLSQEELAGVARALGHPVRQILSHW